MSSSESAAYPLELDLDRRRELRIRWDDGGRSVISLVELRKACPCATCRAEREQQSANPLRVVPALANPDDQVVVQSAELAGNYALRITWQDGHATGIYSFPLLRSLGRLTLPDRPAGG